MWKNININVQNIEHDTGKACLIKMPSKCSYAGYKFWHPSKLIRDNGGKGYFKSLGYTDSFEFKLIKYGKGTYNGRDIIDEVVLSVEEFEEAFDNPTLNTSVEDSNESYLNVTEPNKLTGDIQINEELIND